MTQELYFSRLSLARNPSVDALMELLEPRQRGRAMDNQHRLLWSAFAGDPAQPRDFLWRAEGKGRFYTLSRRPPEHAPLFEAPEVKPFAPQLNIGDRLQFTLRVNATRDRATKVAARGDGWPRSARVDVVMDALYAVRPGQRAAVRMDVAQQVGCDWLIKQGERHGFEPLDVTVTDYRTVALPGHVGRRKGQPQLGILDITGLLEVTAPKLFLAKLGSGFGRARAFGCGLMLIRRTA